MIIFTNTPTDRYPDSGRGNKYSTIPPLGLGYVASEAARAIGRDQVKLLDSEYKGLSPNKTAELLSEYNPSEVGFNVTEPNLPIVLETATELIRKSPKVKLLFGGPQAILGAEGLMKDLRCLDLAKNTLFISTGEGERPIKYFLEGKNLDSIPGIAYYAGAGSLNIIKQGCYLTTDELSEQILDRSFFENDPNRESGKVESYMLSSRGCLFSCAYCASGKIREHVSPRIKKMGEIRQELSVLLDQGINYIRWVDDLFLLNRGRVKEITDMFQAMGLNSDNFGYEANGRANIMADLPDELWDRLAKTGFKELEMGIESGSPRILDLMKKGISPEQVIKTAERAFSRGIGIKGFLMAGYYTETNKDLMLTVELAKRLKEKGGDLIRFSMVPTKDYYGTELHNQLEPIENALLNEGKQLSNDINIDLTKSLNISSNDNPTSFRILQDRTRYNAIPTILTGEGNRQPMALSELSGGASTGKVLETLAEIALISSGIDKETMNTGIIIKKENNGFKQEGNRPSGLERF